MATQPARPIGPGLLTALIFEVATAIATQDKRIRAVSPWQDDPFNVGISVAIFTVPVLAVVIAARLLLWHQPGTDGRLRQLHRAVAVMIGIIGGTTVFEWVAVATGQHRGAWDGWTGLLGGALVVTTLLVTVTVVALVQSRRSVPGSGLPIDWLDDAIALGKRLPLTHRVAKPVVAQWIRRRAMTVFVVSSLVAALGVIGALAISEGWTDPVLFGWAVAVEFCANLAFCLISNSIACFIARPARSAARRRFEAAVVVACLAVQGAVAFRDVVWRVVARHTDLSMVGELVVLTGTAAVVAATLTTVVWRPRH